MDVTRRSMLKFTGVGVAAAGVVAVTPTGLAEAAPPGGSLRAASAEAQGAVKKARQLVARMTLDEKIAYCHGIPASKGFTGHIPANTRLGIPALRLADGPSGVGNGSTGVTQWPDSKALAATWNPGTADEYGRAYGAEQAAKGHNVALAPCINIIRLPHWGRSFETYTEDPYLNGQLAAATIRGIQANHVISTVKHFAANNQEILRTSIDVVVSERALQEIYFPGFRAAVQQGQAGAVMTSYNKVNGTWAHENRVTCRTSCVTRGATTAGSCRTGAAPTAPSRPPRRVRTPRCPAARTSATRSRRPCFPAPSARPSSTRWSPRSSRR